MSVEQKPRDIRVIVRRDTDGQIFSEVIDRAKVLNLYTRDVYDGVVIDRARGRMMDARAVQLRAEHLAKLLGVELDVDLTWPCAADRKLPCRCPKCIESGRA